MCDQSTHKCTHSCSNQAPNTSHIRYANAQNQNQHTHYAPQGSCHSNYHSQIPHYPRHEICSYNQPNCSQSRSLPYYSQPHFQRPYFNANPSIPQYIVPNIHNHIHLVNPNVKPSKPSIPKTKQTSQQMKELCMFF